jgi:hypothetical protein
MLRRLLWENKSRWLMTGAVVGSLVGMILMLFSIQLYIDARSIITKDSDLIGKDFLTVNKKVTIMSTADAANNIFSDEEIEDIRSQPFVEDVAPFVISRYDVTGTFKGNTESIALQTDLWFESIPSKYLDLDDEEWGWEVGDTYLPIVLSSDWLDMFNFRFSQSQGLPMLSESLIESIEMEFKIKGAAPKETFNGRVVGYSQRVSTTILVPQSFMDYANEKFAPGSENEPLQVLLVTDDPTNPELAQYLDENDLITNQDKLKASRTNRILILIVGVIMLIGLIVVALSVLVFILNFQLVISESEDNLRTLIYLGYPPARLSKFYAGIFLKIYLGITVVSVAALFAGKLLLIRYFNKAGIESISQAVGSGLSWKVLVFAVIFAVVFSIGNLLSIRSRVYRLA